MSPECVYRQLFADNFSILTSEVITCQCGVYSSFRKKKKKKINQRCFEDRQEGRQTDSLVIQALKAAAPGLWESTGFCCLSRRSQSTLLSMSADTLA